MPGKKLLIVDDEEEIREFLKEFFEEKGYVVLTANTQQEAKKKILDEEPLLALLDLRMRGERDGFEILGWLKAQKISLKTIMVTGIETKACIEEAFKLGADDYITKPLSLEYLYTTVTEKIEKLTEDGK